jgi:hypothetical protein
LKNPPLFLEKKSAIFINLVSNLRRRWLILVLRFSLGLVLLCLGIGPKSAIGTKFLTPFIGDKPLNG